MKILYCEVCKKKVAEIRDASLLKDMVCLCPGCNKTRLDERQKYANLKTIVNNQYGKNKNPFGDLFKDIGI